jgi:sulfoxide reductase heme-binding subunit YedZ
MTAPSPLWYASRGLGLVLLLTLTASVVLGILTTGRWRPGQEARFLANGLHRNVALVSVVLLPLHGITNALDPFAGIHLQDLVVPFLASYRPLWLGLGVISGELLLAVVVTSLFRVRLGFQAWRLVHWLTYASWPFGFLHGLGTGTDSHSGWMLLIYAVCLGAVVAAVIARLSTARIPAVVKAIASSSVVVAVVAVGVFTFLGPMQPGWARLAGTPTKLLGQGTTNAGQAPSATPAPTPTPLFEPRHHEHHGGDH